MGAGEHRNKPHRHGILLVTDELVDRAVDEYLREAGQGEKIARHVIKARMRRVISQVFEWVAVNKKHPKGRGYG